LDDAARNDLVLGWHRLSGWEDSSAGLSALKERVIIATLSNGNVRLLINMVGRRLFTEHPRDLTLPPPQAKHAHLPWDMIFSSQLFGSYKPDPKVYLGAVELLDLPPQRVAIVAAHIYDCAAAKAAGLRAVYVRRSTEDTDIPFTSDFIKQGKTDAIVDDFWGVVKLIDEADKHAEV